METTNNYQFRADAQQHNKRRIKMNKFFELYRQQNNQVVVALVDDRYYKNQPIDGGKIIGQVAILIEEGYWYKGKKVMADAVRVDADAYNVLCSEYGKPAAPWFPGLRKEPIKKSDTDKKTFALRQALELSQYKEDPTEICTFEGYTWRAGDAVSLLKAMNSEFNKPNKKQLAMFAAADAEQPAAPVVDTPEPEPMPEPTTAADAEQPVAPVVDTPEPEPETTTTSRQKKQLAAWNGAVVEVLEICAADNTAIIKLKGGSRTRIPADALEQTTAKKTTLPDWMVPGAVIDVKNAVRVDAPPARHTVESVKASNIYYTDGTYASINYIMHYGSPAADAKPAEPVADAAVTDADVLATAARIKSNYEAMIQQAAADAAPAPRRRRLNIAPRLSRWLNPARWVAVAVVVCLLSGLLLGMNTSTAADDAAADDIVAVYELHPVTITAAAVTDAPAADAVTPSSQKIASDIAAVTDAPAADAAGLTICEGTPWAYTMMNWA